MRTSRLGRRTYLRAVGSSLATVGITGTTVTASTADQVTLTGKLESYDGNPVTGRKVLIRGNDGSEYIKTDSSGVFEKNTEADSRVYLAFYKSGDGQLHAPVKDNIPHIEYLGTERVGSSDTDVGTISLSKAYSVNLRALDKDGNPVADAGFGFGSEGYGSSNYLLSANDKGYLVINNADFTGIELAESATVSIKIPTDGGAEMKYKESIYVDSPMTVIARQGEGTTIKEHKPGESTETTTTTQATTETTTTTTTSTPTTTAPPTTTTETTPAPTTSQTTSQSTEMAMSANDTETQSKRGFFSNGESAGDYEFLTNPFHLTVGGFVLSVAGIAHNMLRGQ